MAKNDGGSSDLLMKIHNKWYDMAGFVHPGGPIMMALGANRDATALFEAHHPFTSRSYLEGTTEGRRKRRRKTKHALTFEDFDFQGLLSKHEAKAPGKLMDPLDEQQLFEWPEHEQKDPDASVHPEPPFRFLAAAKEATKEEEEGKKQELKTGIKGK
jgi:delta11-fatty-acid desaturase